MATIISWLSFWLQNLSQPSHYPAVTEAGTWNKTSLASLAQVGSGSSCLSLSTKQSLQPGVSHDKLSLNSWLAKLGLVSVLPSTILKGQEWGQALWSLKFTQFREGEHPFKTECKITDKNVWHLPWQSPTPLRVLKLEFSLHLYICPCHKERAASQSNVSEMKILSLAATRSHMSTPCSQWAF